MQTAQISHAEGFQIIYVAILLSRKWDVTSTPETVGSPRWLPSKEYGVIREKSNFTIRKTDNHHRARKIKININSDTLR